MPVPALSTSSAPLPSIECDALVVGVEACEEGAVIMAVNGESQLATYVAEVAQALEIDGALDGTWRIPAPSGYGSSSIVLTGLGKSPHSPDTLRVAAGAALRTSGKASTVALALPANTREDVLAVAEGAMLGAHRVEKLGTRETQGPSALIVAGVAPDIDLSPARITSEAVYRVRDLVNTPPNVLFPQAFADRVLEAIRDLPITAEVLDEKELRDQGFGGISAVGQGSAHPPRLVVLRYEPTQPTRHVSLVGKGITFDSGGLSLKPAGSMVGMKYDMTGAAIVAAATIAAAQLHSDVKVTAFLCLAENMPSGSALRPNDVITMKSGKTVEILNTDAEGRLVLADGLHLASAEAPDLVIDIATLTGAARVALGERYAGLMGTPSAVLEVQQAAERTGELVWPMPLPEELRSLLKTDVADIANAKPGNTLGGMLLAGVFLREFVDPSIPWAHLDIAGPASNSSSAWGYTPQGPTGALTRTLIDILSGARARQS